MMRPLTVVLGQHFLPPQADELNGRIESIPRFTYRKGFAALPQSGVKTDRSWGCCIRCGQGLLAQYIARYSDVCHEGYERRFHGDYRTLFADEPSAPFGIHLFCDRLLSLGSKIGELVTPSLLANVIEQLLAMNGLSAVLPEDGLISRSKLDAVKR
jgi:hypothetical protein